MSAQSANKLTRWRYLIGSRLRKLARSIEIVSEVDQAHVSPQMYRLLASYADSKEFAVCWLIGLRFTNRRVRPHHLDWATLGHKFVSNLHRFDRRVGEPDHQMWFDLRYVSRKGLDELLPSLLEIGETEEYPKIYSDINE